MASWPRSDDIVMFDVPPPRAGRTASAAKVTCPANPRNICLETLEAETFQSGGYVVAASRVLSRGRDG